MAEPDVVARVHQRLDELFEKVAAVATDVAVIKQKQSSVYAECPNCPGVRADIATVKLAVENHIAEQARGNNRVWDTVRIVLQMGGVIAAIVALVMTIARH